MKCFPRQRTRRGSSDNMQSLPLLRDLPRARGSREREKGACALSPYKLSRTRPGQAPNMQMTSPTHPAPTTHFWVGDVATGQPTSPAVPTPLEGIQGGHWGQGEQARESSWIKGHGRGRRRSLPSSRFHQDTPKQE